MWTGWVIGLLGIWMIIVPFLGLTATADRWIDWIVGAIVAILGFAMASRKPAQGWITGLFGVWLFVAAFIAGIQGGAAIYWNDIIVGLIFVIFGFAGSRGGRRGEVGGQVPHTA